MTASGSTGDTPGARAPAAPSPGRGWLIASGILGVIAGMVAIAVPAVASLGAAIFFGWLLIAVSVVMLVGAFGAGGFVRVAGRLLLALLTLGAGIYLVAAPQRGAFTLTVMLAIWFVAIGGVRIVAGLVELRTPGAGLIVVSGVVSLILGLLIFAELPSSAAWAIGLILGIDFLFAGFTDLGAAAQLKSNGRSADRAVPGGPAPRAA